MFIELFEKPIVIKGEPLSKANINLDYKLKNVPAHRIRNKNLRNAKIKWDACNQYKDMIALQIRSEMNRRSMIGYGIPIMAFIALDFYFKFKKTNNPADKRKDMDNCEKVFFDSVEASGIIEGDQQVVRKLVGKYVTKTDPCLVIHSICVTDDEKNYPGWLYGQLQRLQKDPYYFS